MSAQLLQQKINLQNVLRYDILFCLLQYKSTPSKKISILGWMVALPDDPEHPDIFQLNNPDKGKFCRMDIP